ncbi:MAG: endo-1,4-beta-xylanase [Tannerella sp.]|jgi:GH35 family endo-1,4-beta-xylanase/endonuclease/exonuclease/phosphatase family metal-dependent hydrolase|nr:endo-1,4-beta-xylanase [Tannerella sp.]
MKTFIFTLLCLASMNAFAQPEGELKVATYNIRYLAGDDVTKNDGVNAWTNRREHLKALVLYHDFDIFGVQEAQSEHQKDLCELPGYGWYLGRGVDDGKHPRQQANSIFYKKDRLQLLESGDFWLSETPDQPSLGWDVVNCCNRICSWVRLKDLRTQKELYFFNVHFDHQGVVARQESGKLMVRKIREIAGDRPAICTGDLNSTPDKEQIQTLETLLNDSYKVSKAPPYGPEGTFNGFRFDAPLQHRIDYVFVSRQITVWKYAVLTDSKDRRYPSDHLPVVVHLTIDDDGSDWKTAADARIEQHRKENVRMVLTQNGKPVPGAKIRMEMRRHEFLFGSNVFGWKPEDENAVNEYNRLFAGIFNFGTMGFYWKEYEPENGKPGYASSERIAAWCAANGIRAKGHPLVWNTGEPEWIKDFSDEALFERQMKRVTDCAKHFRGTIETWDVINEVVGWDREKYWEYAPRLTALVANKIGKVEFSKASFAAARKGNPKATLLINDWMADERYAELIARLTGDDGKPLYDAIGIQSHMHSGTWSNDKIWETCERFAGFGRPIHFTEVTILSTHEKADWGSLKEDILTTGDGEEWQRDEVVRFYTMLFSHPAVEAITWWDFSDRNAWRHAPAGLLRKDMTPKPAYEALRKLIREEWSTRATVETDRSGSANIRAFRGEYLLTVTLPDGRQLGLSPEAVVGKKDNLIELKVENLQ